MYDQPQTQAPATQRIIRIALWAVIVLAVAWVVIWFSFFRNRDSADTSKLKTTSQSQTAKKADTSDTKNQKSRQSSTSTNQDNKTQAQNNTSGSDTAANEPSPSRLVNAGAGDIWVPVAVAIVAGAGVSQVILRLKKRIV